MSVTLSPRQSVVANLSITELSRRTGLTVRALKHYEEIGLLGASRPVGGARVYLGVDLMKIELIAQLRSAGVELADIVAAYRAADPADIKRSLRLAARSRLDRIESDRLLLEIFLTSQEA